MAWGSIFGPAGGVRLNRQCRNVGIGAHLPFAAPTHPGILPPHTHHHHPHPAHPQPRPLRRPSPPWSTRESRCAPLGMRARAAPSCAGPWCPASSSRRVAHICSVCHTVVSPHLFGLSISAPLCCAAAATGAWLAQGWFASGTRNACILFPPKNHPREGSFPTFCSADLYGVGGAGLPGDAPTLLNTNKLTLNNGLLFPAPCSC